MNEKELFVYINGSFYPESKAKISVLDHGFLYGDGVFEGIREYNGRIFKLEEHVDRLYESAKTIALEISIPKSEMMENCAETLRRNQIKNGYIRLIVSRGFGKLGLDPRKCEKPTIVIIPSTYVITLGGLKPINVIVSSTRRWGGYPALVKSLNYLNNVIARIEAINANADEAIMLDHRGYICEGAGDNIFIVKKGKLFTPPLHASILAGITRQTVLELAERLGIEVVERDLTIHELYNADEAFLTGTGVEVHPIAEVDNRTIGSGKVGPVSERIVEEFKKETQKPEVSYPVFKEI